MTTRTIDLAHARLHLGEPGRPSRLPSLLLVHGAWLGAWCYERFVKAFVADGIRTAALDLRGHGGLPQDELFLRSGQNEMAEDIIEAAGVLGGEVIVAGHSAGGAVAAIAASRCPAVGLILLAPSPPGQLPGLERLPAEPEGAPVPPGSLDHIRRKFVPNHDQAAARAVAARLVGESPALLNDRRLLRTRVDVERISGPALCLAAEKELHDFHAPGQDLATARFYGAEYWFLDGMGHCFMLEDDWRRPATIVSRWVRARFAVA